MDTMGVLPDRSKAVLRYILEQNASEAPDKECLIFEDGERWTYAKALREAYRAANVLSQLGVKRGDNVLIFLPNSQGWIHAWWGATFLGAVIVPVNTAYKGEMLKHICLDSQAKHMITTLDLAPRLEGLGVDLNILDPATLAQGPDDEHKLDGKIEAWDIHMLMYTSGTTGSPKGVMVPYLQNFQTICFSYSNWFTGDDTFLMDHPLFHGSGMWPMYSMFSLGGRIVVRTVFSASRYLDIVRDAGVTTSLMMPATCEFLAATPPKPDDADNPLRLIFGILRDSEAASFLERFGIEDCIGVYGMTELGNVLRQDPPIMNRNSYCRVRPDLEVRLVDEHDIPVTPGEVGELIVRSNLPWALNAGYWRRPEQTARAWQNGWFHTGDLLYCDEQGNYFFADRKNDAIRRRGENISSSDVERAVLAYPDVLECSCIGVPAKFDRHEVKVFIVIREGAAFDPADLIEFLIPRMPYFMVPRYVEVIDVLPKNHAMRIKKHVLRERGNSDATWDREAAGILVRRDA